MRTSEEIDKIAAALVKFQGEVESPKKTAENPAFKRDGKTLKYADLDAIIKTITPTLLKNGLSQHQFVDSETDTKTVKVTTMLLHESGQFIISDQLTLPAENRGKYDAQSVGSAVTYGRRYSLSAILGIASENDDDANSISGQDKADKQNNQQPKTYNKPPEAKVKIASYEEKDRLMNKLREYVAIRGMDDEAGLNQMVGWVCKQTKAKSFDVLTSPQAFSATEKIDQLILAEFQKTDESKTHKSEPAAHQDAQVEQVGMEMQYNIPEK